MTQPNSNGQPLINLTNEFIKNSCEPPGETVVNWGFIVARILVCLFGILGNLMVFFVILIPKEQKKAVTHWYVLQLAIADTLFLLTLPFKMIEDTHGEWIFGTEMCKLKETMLFFNYFSSIMFLMVMSIDRYIAVCHGFSNTLQQFRSKRTAYITTVFVWSLSLILCIPIILYSEMGGFEPHCTCAYEFPKDTNFTADCEFEIRYFVNETFQNCVERKESQSKQFCRKLECGEMEESFQSITNGLGFFSETPSFSGDFPVFLSNPSSLSSLNIINETNVSENSSRIPEVYNPGCSYTNVGRGFSTYLYFNFVVMFIIPLIILTACYSLIALNLRKANIRRRKHTTESVSSLGHKHSGKFERKRSRSASTEKTRKNRIRVTYTCFFLVLLFVVCWLPFHAVHLAKIHGISNTTQFCTDIAVISSIIAYINSAINPYIYNCTGEKFRKRLKEAFKSATKHRTSSMSSSGSTRHHVRRQGTSVKMSSTNAVPMTKLYKLKSESESTQRPSDVVEEAKQETDVVFTPVTFV